MTEKMRSRWLGMMMACVSQGAFPHREPVPYLYDAETQTLSVNEDDGSLSFGWDWTTMQMDVEAVK